MFVKLTWRSFAVMIPLAAAALLFMPGQGHGEEKAPWFQAFER